MHCFVSSKIETRRRLFAQSPDLRDGLQQGAGLLQLFSSYSFSFFHTRCVDALTRFLSLSLVRRPPNMSGTSSLMGQLRSFQMKSMPCFVRFLNFLHSAAAFSLFLVVMNLSFKRSTDCPAFFSGFGSVRSFPQ